MCTLSVRFSKMLKQGTRRYKSYTVLMMTRKLKHYFLVHTIWVVSDRLLACVLQSKEATGQIAQWALEIGQYDIEFIP
jgi:hypothetical protein